MERDFIYCRRHTSIGVKVEEISGCEDKSGALWNILAKQIYCENGRDGYRSIEHYPSGVPYLYGEPVRISVSHTGHMLVVASLPKTPEADLSAYSPRTALGIDVETADREQVLKVRERYLGEEELALVSEDNLQDNILAWTAKEAIYKAAMIEGLDFREQIRIVSLPRLDAEQCGEAVLKDAKGGSVNFLLYSYTTEGYIVTIAITDKTATFKKRK